MLLPATNTSLVNVGSWGLFKGRNPEFPVIQLLFHPTRMVRYL